MGEENRTIVVEMHKGIALIKMDARERYAEFSRHLKFGSKVKYRVEGIYTGESRRGRKRLGGVSYHTDATFLPAMCGIETSHFLYAARVIGLDLEAIDDERNVKVLQRLTDNAEIAFFVHIDPSEAVNRHAEFL
jgi:hypothetical protein